MQSFKLKFLGVTILQGVEFPIFPIDFAWALQQCSATALPVIKRYNSQENLTFKTIKIDRAGFSSSRARFRKNVGPFTGGGRPYFFFLKIGDIFGHHCIIVCQFCSVTLFIFFWKTGDLFGYHCHFYSFFLVHSGVAHYFRHAKICRFSCGALFVGALVRPNMLNMPKKSAAENRL